MRDYAKVTSVGLLMMGLLATPNLSSAKDGDGKHLLLNADLRAKVERLRDRIEDSRERHHHNEGGVPGSVTALQTEIATLKAALATANGQLSVLDGRLKTLEQRGAGGGSVDPMLVELAKYVKVDPAVRNGVPGPHVIFHHANVHVQSGSGIMPEYDIVNGTIVARQAALNGLGNLIVGYNDVPVPQGFVTSGSHNIVVGQAHTFTSLGGVIYGNNNTISGPYATVLGGRQNHALAPTSSVLGGFNTTVNTPEETYP